MLRDDGREQFDTSASVGRKSSRLNCAQCQAAITSSSEKTEMGGSHEHVFVNPDGERFRIGCFSDAPGLVRYGPASFEATWFSGYSWQNELCAKCRSFLGWLYRKGEHRFHGLVLDQLIEVEED